MRKLIVCNIMSLDGYYTGSDNNVMVLPMDDAVDAYNAERLRAAETLLLGAGTPRFDGQPAVSLRLIAMRRWGGAEHVLVRYDVHRHKT